MTSRDAFARTGLDAVALKPTECDVSRAADLPADLVAIDYEGRDAVPGDETLARLAESIEVRLTTPVRADGYDPLGADDLLATLPENVGRVVVAGHPAYLSKEEQSRAVSPRFGAARESHPGAWVGTEGVERIALAAGGTQYELLSRSTERDVRGLRAAGFDGDIALYAPTVLTDDEDAVLDAVGDYAARRRPVASALPDDPVTGARAAGRTREILSAAVRDYGLVGTPETVGERVDRLHDIGVETVVGYPARGIDEFLPSETEQVASDD